MQLQLQFMENIYYTQCNYCYNSRKTFNIHNATTITIHEKHLIYTMQLQLQFIHLICTMQLQLHFIERFKIHNTTTITIHEKHSIYTMQLQLQFMKNI